MTNNAAAAPVFDLKEWRAGFIRIILRIAAVLGVVMFGVSFPTATTSDRLLFGLLYLILLSITLFPAPYFLRAYLLLAMTGIVGVNAILAWGPWADGTIFLLSTVVLASLLLDNRTDFILLGGFIVFTLSIAFFSLQGVYQISAPNAPKTLAADWGIYIADFSIFGIIVATAANMLKGAFSRAVAEMQSVNLSLSMEQKELEEKVSERSAELEMRMAQLRASAATTRAIAETQESSGLLAKAADLIADRFEYYHVGVYLLDDQRKSAHLQSASSAAGKSLVGQSFRIERDRRNLFATAVESMRPVLTSDLEAATFLKDKDFPLTRSRMILPLSVRGSLIGLLDIHSDQPRAFNPQDAEILQTLADLTAISFDNARLIDETRNLVTQLKSNTSLQTQRTWSKFVSRHKNAYLYTPAGVRPLFAQEKKDETADGLNLPIILHGQSIGRIRLKKRSGIPGDWSNRERDLVEKISVQVGLALENSRLVDEAQKNALRNQMLANFSTYVRETLDVESVIRAAATELRKVFDLKEAEIVIGSAQADTAQPSAQQQGN